MLGVFCARFPPREASYFETMDPCYKLLLLMSLRAIIYKIQNFQFLGQLLEFRSIGFSIHYLQRLWEAGPGCACCEDYD